MPSKNPGILEYVPASLRAVLPNYESVLPAVLSNALAQETDDMDTILGFISGAITFQELSEDESSKSFKGTIVRVEELKRESSGFLLGKKARIVFEGTTQSGAVKEQTIDTGWLEFYGFNAHTEAFNMALANTIVQIAEENIGKECFIRKVLVSGVTTSQGGDKVRFIGDLNPVETKDNQKSSGRTQAKSRSDKADDDSLTVRSFRDEAKRQGVDIDGFEKADIVEILQFVSDDDIEGISEVILDVLGGDSKGVLKELESDDFQSEPLKVIIRACA